MELRAIVMTMLPGRYGTRHATRWSASMASCKATRCHHQTCAHAVLARQMPLSSLLPLSQNTNKKQLLASNYCTFLLAELSIFVTWKGPSTRVIDATSFVIMQDAMIQEEAISYISSYQTLTADKNLKIIKQRRSSLKKWLHVCDHSG